MDIKSLKKLNKNFDKEWERLSAEDKKSCVIFMLGTLRESDHFYKEASNKLINAKTALNQIIDDDTIYFVNNLKQMLKKMTDKKYMKEDKLQEEIMSTNNRQLLFSDIYKTYMALDELKEQVHDILEQTKQVIDNGTNSISANKLSTLVLQVELLAEAHERYIDVFDNQTSKVKQLFAEFVKAKDDELAS